jgi:hypothetical protein
MSVATGSIAWSGNVLTLPLSMVFPALWGRASNRRIAAAVAAGYFLAASRGLPQGVAAYFGTTVWAGVLLWFAASLSFVSVHVALWTRQPGWRRMCHYLLVAFIMAVPPFGIVGWAHPITSAGVLFPGGGWCGLCATLILLAAMVTRFWLLAAVVIASAWLLSLATWAEPPKPAGWHGVDMALSAALGSDQALEQHHWLVGIARQYGAKGAYVIVVPESVFGIWTSTIERFWTDALAGTDLTVIGGAVVLDPIGYDNVIVRVDGHSASILYRARMPVPVSMWQPWRIWFGEPGGARATFFADPIVEIAGRRVVPLICYEQLLIWPILQSALYRPDTIVAIANGWWASGTSIPAIQQAAVLAWSRLFDLALVSSVNR